MNRHGVKAGEGLVKGLGLNPSPIPPQLFRGPVDLVKGVKGFTGIHPSHARTRTWSYATKTLHPLHLTLGNGRKGQRCPCFCLAPEAVVAVNPFTGAFTSGVTVERSRLDVAIARRAFTSTRVGADDDVEASIAVDAVPVMGAVNAAVDVQSPAPITTSTRAQDSRSSAIEPIAAETRDPGLPGVCLVSTDAAPIRVGAMDHGSSPSDAGTPRPPVRRSRLVRTRGPTTLEGEEPDKTSGDRYHCGDDRVPQNAGLASPPEVARSRL